MRYKNLERTDTNFLHFNFYPLLNFLKAFILSLILPYQAISGDFPGGTKFTCLAIDKNYVWLGGPESIGGEGIGIKRYDKFTEKWITLLKADGLISNGVTCLTTDLVDERYLWIGTYDGISKYDKRNNAWDNFSMEELGIENAIVTTICVDSFSKDYVWVGTTRGVTRYSRSKNQWEKITTPNGLMGAPLSSDPELKRRYNAGHSVVRVTVIMCDEKYIWFGTDGNGIYQLNRKTKRYKHTWIPNGWKHEFIFCGVANQKYVWFGTGGGLSVFNKLTNKWKVYKYTPISSMTLDPNNTTILWAATSRKPISRGPWLGGKYMKLGICEFDIHNAEWKEYKITDYRANEYRSGEINEIALDSGYIWVATWGSNIVKFDKNSKKWQIYKSEIGLGNNSVKGQIVFDPSDDDIIYLGNHIFSRKNNEMKTLIRDCSQLVPDTNCVWYWRESCWTALFKYDPKHQKTMMHDTELRREGNSRFGIFHIAIISNDISDNNYIWAGTHKRSKKVDGKWVYDSKTTSDLCRYNKSKDEWSYFPVPQSQLFRDFIVALSTEKEYVWVGTESGNIYQFDKSSQKWLCFAETPSKKYGFLRVLTIDPVDKKSIWVGTAEGLFQYNRNTKKYIRYTTSGGLINNGVNSIAIDKVDSKYIWVGTDAGVSRYDRKNGKWTNFSREIGLIDHHILYVAVDCVDKSSVWIDTQFAGLHRFDRNENTWYWLDNQNGKFVRLKPVE